MPPGHFIHQSVEHGAGHLVVLFMLYKTAKVHVFSRPESEQMIMTDRRSWSWTVCVGRGLIDGPDDE